MGEAVEDLAVSAHARGESLSLDMVNILGDLEFSDFILVSNDGQRIPACRSILAARSPFFHTMFRSGMSESNRCVKELSLPAITTPALLATLEYIYSGGLSKYALTLENVYEVICAARFFMLKKLEQDAIQFSKEVDLKDAHVATKSLSRALDILSVEEDECSLLHIVRSLQKCNLEAIHMCNFSAEALSYFLDKSRTRSIRFLVSEYIRLRRVILLCACLLSGNAEKVLAAYLPNKKDIYSVIRERGSLEPYRPKEDAALQPGLEEYRVALAFNLRSWLPFINFTQIHSQILVKVIEPLGIVPSQDLAHAFRFQALYSMEMMLLGWKRGAHASHYRIDEEGWVIESTRKAAPYSFARGGLALTRGSGQCVWDFVIEQTCNDLGVGITEGDERYKFTRFYGWILMCTGHLYHHVESSERAQIKYGKAFGTNSRVRVLLDMEKAICSFIIDDEEYGVAWDKLPEELYPAVSLSAPGRIRLELVDGFENKQDRLITQRGCDSVRKRPRVLF